MEGESTHEVDTLFLIRHRRGVYGLSYMPSGMLEQTDEVEETASQDAQEGVDPTAEDTAARPDDLKSSAP
jgi:hypothetical protein